MRFSLLNRSWRCLIVGAVLLLCSVHIFAQDYWTPLNNDDLMREARAAFHVGYLDADALPTSPTLAVSTSLDLVNRLLARPEVAGELQIKAYRLKLQIFDRRGNDALWQQTFDSLPNSIAGVSNQDWKRQKDLWEVVHAAAMFDWGKVKSGLAHLDKSMFHGEAKADFVKHKCRHDIRESGGGIQGYIDLATEIANDATWDIDDPYFDPYFGQTDFSHLETWAAIQPLLDLLGSNPEDREIGLRRWFEFAAPSALNPLGVLFPDAPMEVRAQLTAQFREKSLLFAPDPLAPVPMTGGWRELLANSVKIENLAYTGQAFEILEAVEVMANSITGLPDELVFAHKMGWRMFGWGGTLAVGAATDAIPVVKTSIELLPPAPFRAFVSALLGLVQLSQADPEGNEYFARAFLITIPHPMIADQMLRGLGSGTEGVNSQAVLDVLAQTPYMASVRPQVLAARSSFAIRRINEFPEDQRVGILTAALADGATALDLLERNWEPVQVQWRDHLKDLLVGAVNTVEGPVHAENARRGFDQDKPIRQNATLHRYAPNIGGPSNSVPIIASTAPEFDLLEHEIKKANANTTDTLNSLLATIPDDQLHEALRTLPDNLLNPYRVFVACGLIRESKRRGVTEANFVSGDWRKFRLKRAELDLCAHDSIAGAQAELASICGDSAFPEDLRARAHVISDGIGPMNTMDAYLWAQDWLSLIEKDNNHRPHIFHLIKRQVADAPTKSEVAVFLNNPDVPPMVRMNHHYNIGVVQMETGDDTSAEANFTKVIAISDAEMSVDDVFRYVAESHRFGIWWRQARLSGDPETKLDTYQRVLTYARERVETLQFHDELRINLARWGWNAAVAMGDDEAAEMFKAIATSEARTKLF